MTLDEVVDALGGPDSEAGKKFLDNNKNPPESVLKVREEMVKRKKKANLQSAARAAAKMIKKVIKDADIELPVRQKATHFRMLESDHRPSVGGHLRSKWLDAAIWDTSAADYVLETGDEEEQFDRQQEVEDAANELLLREGIIGRRAKRAEKDNNMPTKADLILREGLIRLAHQKPEHRKLILPIIQEFDAVQKAAGHGKGEDVSMETVKKELGEEGGKKFEEMNKNPPESVQKVKEEMEKKKNKGKGKGKDKKADESGLRADLIRLAKRKPEHRKAILELLRDG